MDIITQKEIASIICYFLPSHMQIKDELQYKLKIYFTFPTGNACPCGVAVGYWDLLKIFSANIGT